MKQRNVLSGLYRYTGRNKPGKLEKKGSAAVQSAGGGGTLVRHSDQFCTKIRSLCQKSRNQTLWLESSEISQLRAVLRLLLAKLAGVRA